MNDLSIKVIQDTVTPAINSIMSAIDGIGRNKALSKVAETFKIETQSNFGSSGTFKANQWPPLSVKYAKKVGSSEATLNRSGKLKNSIMVGNINKDSISVYTTNPYAAAQMFGYKKKNLPARNFWPAEFTSPNYSKLIYKSQVELTRVIETSFNVSSNGNLPIETSGFQPMTPAYGNLFSN